MKIAVVGGGGREHAIVRKLRQSPECGELVAIPGNGGIARDALCVPVSASDVAGIVRYCVDNAVDYVVVAPEEPLSLGLVDELAKAGIPAFGPTAAAARVEASKVFSKRLMQKYGIPTAACEVFEDAAAALAYVGGLGRWPAVVKADGLALGKGVLICQNAQEARAAVRGMMAEGKFGGAGSRVVIEEYLRGPEVTVMAFCDGERCVPMLSSMDHKRALDGDGGLNTGGMGAIAPSPFYTAELARRCEEQIFAPTVRALAAEGCPFRGCLYFGLMLTDEGPKVIEYNCRFGDPETQAVLPLLESDLTDVMRACTEGRLRADMVRFGAGAAACVVMASGGYPLEYARGYPISGLERAEARGGVSVYHAGTALRDGRAVTAGGRVLGVTATCDTLPDAIRAAYAAVGDIHFENAHCRRDIGAAACAAQRGV